MTKKQKAQDVLSEIQAIIGKRPFRSMTNEDCKLYEIHGKLLAYYTRLKSERDE